MLTTTTTTTYQETTQSNQSTTTTTNFNLDNYSKLEDESLNFLDNTRRINLIASIVIILIGLLGNCLTIFVFSQKRFRINSSNVYLLCLALIDSLFLVVHIFEDLIREYEEIYSMKDTVFDSILNELNLIDNYILTCFLISFLKYFLRFISAYIIVAFTLQRLILVCSPLNIKFKSKRSAWYIVLLIVSCSFVFNAWVPFLFRIDQQNEFTKPRCDVLNEYKNEYFIITIIYTSLIMLIPILTVFICNFIIILKIKKADLKRNTLQNKKELINGRKSTDQTFGVRANNNNYQIRAYYLPNTRFASRKKNEDSKKLTKTLILISFSYAVFNLPYFITW